MRHSLVEQEGRSVATVSFDYMFVTRGAVYSRDEFEKSAECDLDPKLVLKVLVVRDSKK